MIVDVGDRDFMDELKGRAATEWRRLGRFEDYYGGNHVLPYIPETSTREFRLLVKRSTTNLTRLVINTLVQRLVVDGYKASATDVENAKPWDWWQQNGMDSRQKALYEETSKHGYAYMLVAPQSFRAENDPRSAPLMAPVSPREWYAEFESFADDFPMCAVKADRSNDRLWWVLDDVSLRKVRFEREGARVDYEAEHGLGVCPLVPYRNAFELTRWPTGEIEPIIAVQDRLNQTVFDLLVAQTYSAAPQKYIAGLIADEGPDGKPIVDLAAFAKSVWFSTDKDTRFGSIPEANLSNLVTAIDNTLRVYGLMSQTPPHYLLGQIVNLSAEALLAADTTLAKKVLSLQAILGEAHEWSLRLAARASGDPAQYDESSQVWWRDTEPRSIAQQVDALGKMVTMLGVPQEAAWEKIPGITNTDLQMWRAMRRREELRAALTAPVQPPPTAPTAPAPSTNERSVNPVPNAGAA